MLKLSTVAALGLMLIASPCHAKEWIVDSSTSKLGFTGHQGSEAFNGFFKNFQANIDLDPDHPEAGKIAATIDIASITAGSSERDSYLPQAEWFDTKKFPQAQFTSTGIQKTSDGHFTANGNLTIKNVSKPVVLPFTLTPEGDHWRAQGSVALTRTDFAVGTDTWGNEDYVKFPVTVTIDLSAKPKS